MLIYKAVKDLNIFDIVGADFFKPLSGQNKEIYYDCLSIIFRAYRTESSFGIDREILMSELTDYFDKNNDSDIISDEDGEIFHDPKSKASEFLRRLKRCGWIESEFSNDRREKIIMPGYSVDMLKVMEGLVRKNDAEYQSEISAIYSILVNEELLDHPYPQIIMPVYEHTMKFFTELKKLNTDIRKYIDELTDGQTPEEIMEHFFGYNERIASKAYHRLHTGESVARFRNKIVSNLNLLLENADVMNKSAILRLLADDLNREEEYGPDDDASDEVCRIFNLFPQSFINGESLKAVAISRKIRNVAEIYTPQLMSEEEREQRRQKILEKNKNRFSRKNVSAFVARLLKDKPSIKASEIDITCKRDMMRIIFINLYGRDKRSDFIIIPLQEQISREGFSFRDFTIKRRVK